MSLDKKTDANDPWFKVKEIKRGEEIAKRNHEFGENRTPDKGFALDGFNSYNHGRKS